MKVSLELFLLVNFLMNAMVMGICARSTGRVHWKRVLFAAAFGAIYAVLMQWSPYHILNTWPMKAILLLLLTAIAIRAERASDLFTGAFRFIACTFFIGGVMLATRRLFTSPSWTSILIAAPIAGIALVMALGARNRRLEKWEVQLMLRTRYGLVRMNALIDTGNRLREPISGLPVLIVEARSVRKLLPPGFSVESSVQRVPPGFRIAQYGALGGGGRLLLMRPDEMLMSYGDGWARAPDLWVGLYPGRMPGQVRALAPPIMGRVQPATMNNTQSG